MEIGVLASTGIPTRLLGSVSAQSQGPRLSIIGGLTLDLNTKAPVLNSRIEKQLYSIGLSSETSGAVAQISTPYPAHSVLVHPKDRSVIFAIPNEPGSSEVMEINLNDGKVTKLIKSSTGSGFYGHGLISADEQHLLLVEFDGNDATIITVREFGSYKVVGQFNVHGKNPHALVHCDATDPGCIIVCCSTVANVVETKTGVLRRSYVAPEPSQRFGHIQAVPDGKYYLLAGVAAPYDRLKTEGHLYAVSAKDERVKKLEYPKPIFGEALSSAVDIPRMLMIVTHQDADLVTLWDLKSDKCLAALPVPNRPRGAVCLDSESCFLVTNILGHHYTVGFAEPFLAKKMPNTPLVSNAPHLLRAEVLS